MFPLLFFLPLVFLLVETVNGDGYTTVSAVPSSFASCYSSYDYMIYRLGNGGKVDTNGLNNIIKARQGGMTTPIDAWFDPGPIVKTNLCKKVKKVVTSFNDALLAAGFHNSSGISTMYLNVTTGNTTWSKTLKTNKGYITAFAKCVVKTLKLKFGIISNAASWNQTTGNKTKFNSKKKICGATLLWRKQGSATTDDYVQFGNWAAPSSRLYTLNGNLACNGFNVNADLLYSPSSSATIDVSSTTSASVSSSSTETPSTSTTGQSIVSSSDFTVSTGSGSTSTSSAQTAAVSTGSSTNAATSTLTQTVTASTGSSTSASTSTLTKGSTSAATSASTQNTTTTSTTTMAATTTPIDYRTMVITATMNYMSSLLSFDQLGVVFDSMAAQFAQLASMSTMSSNLTTTIVNTCNTTQFGVGTTVILGIMNDLGFLALPSLKTTVSSALTNQVTGIYNQTIAACTAAIAQGQSQAQVQYVAYSQFAPWATLSNICTGEVAVKAKCTTAQWTSIINRVSAIIKFSLCPV